MKVLSFDPGFERLGIAVLERVGGKDSLLHSDCIHTPASLPFHERLALLGRDAEALIEQFKPSAIALEKVYFEKNVKTAIGVAQVYGVLSFLAAIHTCALYEYTPLEVKVAVTGYGKSDKAAVAAMVGRLITLPARKRLDDELDAIAIGLTCLAVRRT